MKSIVFLKVAIWPRVLYTVGCLVLFVFGAKGQNEIELFKKLAGADSNGRVASDYFGWSVSVSGDVLVAGANFQDFDSAGHNLKSAAGAVFIFQRTSGGTNSWGFVKKLTGNGAGTHGREISDLFGQSLSISGDVVVVGAPTHKYDSSGSNPVSEAGAVYIYYRHQGGTDNWGFVKKLTGSSAGTNGRVTKDEFGYSVSVSGDVLVVGARLHDFDSLGSDSLKDAGAAYVFHRNQGGADNWGFMKKLIGSSAGSNGRLADDQFGVSVSVSNNVLTVGSFLQDYDSVGSNNLSGAGAAYVFYRNQGGTDNWGFVKKLTGASAGSNGRMTNDNFGKTVSVSGDVLVAGALQNGYDSDGNNYIFGTGAAYVFHRNQGGADNWGFVKKLTGASAGTNGRVIADNFGYALSVSGNVLLVSSPYNSYDSVGGNALSSAGAAYLFYRNQGGTDNWGFVKKLTGASAGSNGRLAFDYFGYSAAVSGGTLIIGARGQDYDSAGANYVSYAGAAYAFGINAIYNSGSWGLVVPGPNTGEFNCHILNGSPSLANGTEVKNLLISSGASLTLSGSDTLKVFGDFLNDGSFNCPGTLMLKGSSAQSTEGSLSISNLALDNSLGASLSDSLKITGLLTLTSGTLTTNGKLVLTSSGVTSYGQISATGTGSMSGAVAMEKSLSNTNAGWRQIGIPVNTTIGNLTGINLLGTAHGTANQRNIYYWDATVSSGNNATGWVTATTATDGNGKAYVVYGSNSNGALHSLTSTWRISGSLVTGNQTFTLVASDDPNGGGSSDKTGWNLIPNPYATNLDVSQLWGASGFPTYKAIHVWDAVNGQYVGICSTGVSVNTYNNSGGTSSATILQPYQAFWVKTSANQTLTLTDGMRTTSMTGAGVFMKKSYPTLRLTLTDENDHRDQVVVYFHAEGQKEFNEATDAYKLFSLNGEVPSLYLYTQSGSPLSIKALPEALDSMELPLSIQNPQGGTIRLTPDLSTLPQEWEVYLKDTRDGSTKALQAGDTITSDPGKGSEGELFLVLKKKQGPGTGVKEAAVTGQLEVGSDGTRVWIAGKHLSWERSAYRLYDLSGRNVLQGTLVLSHGKGMISLMGLERGVYLLQIDASEKSHTISKY